MTAAQGQERLRSGLRLVLAVTTLVIYLVDPSEHPARRPFAQAVLALFALYGVAAYLVGVRRGKYVPSAAAPWIDFAWVTVLVAVSEGTSNIFYPLFLFPILYASFGNGFRIGILVAVSSAASFAVIGVLTAPPGSLDMNAYLTRPLYLLVLGSVTAVWGGHEVRSRARLALLRDVTALSNPRFGVGRTEANILEAIRAYFGAESCWLVVAEARAQRRWARVASRRGGAPEQVHLPDELGETLLSTENAFLVYSHLGWMGRRELCVEHLRLDGEDWVRANESQDGAVAVAEALEAGALLSLPFRYHATASARLYVARRRSRRFDRSDLDFTRHLLDQVGPVLENLRLVDRLASDAATEERRRIARDMHDSVIQPYLALRLGLSAAHTALAGGRSDEGISRVARLVELADGEIQTLRGYLGDLRAGGEGAPHGSLETAVRRFCSRYSDATGIRVDVAVEGQPVQNARLAAEVFQMVAEALSNVRRHTLASRAEVRIESAADRLRLTIANDHAAPDAADFHPRSIGERAASLGGAVRVDHPDRGTTAVSVDIPL